MKNLVLKACLSLATLSSVAAHAQVNSSNKATQLNSVFVDVHPLMIGVGSVGVDVAVAVNEYWTTGVSASHTEAVQGNQGYKGSSLGLIGTYFLNTQAVDTAYIKLGGQRGQLNASLRDDDTNEENHSHSNYGGVSAVAGRHWIWKNNVTMKLGAGVAYNQVNNNADKKIEIKKGKYKISLPESNLRGVRPTGEFSVGIAF